MLYSKLFTILDLKSDYTTCTICKTFSFSRPYYEYDLKSYGNIKIIIYHMLVVYVLYHYCHDCLCNSYFSQFNEYFKVI